MAIAAFGRCCALYGASLFLLIFQQTKVEGATAFSVQPASNQGFDVFADGVLVAPIRLSANGAIVADQVVTTSTGLHLSSLRAADAQAVVFAADDFVDITIPATTTNAPEPIVQFKLTIQSFNTNKWLALFPGSNAPFHFLICSMPAAKVWHQRGWLNATPVSDPFPLLQDVHTGSPEISCLWNRNWGYICPLGGHSIPMIGLWDPAASRYLGYDFQGARATDGSERFLATAYCWQQNASSNFIALAYPHGGDRFGQQVYPRGGEVLASWFSLEIDTALPDTEDPNERFQTRLFSRFTNSLPLAPAMNDLGWIPGYAHSQNFPGPPGLNLYGTDNVPFRSTNTVVLRGWPGHREMPIDTAFDNANSNSISTARTQLEYLLTNYAQVFTAGGETCLYWTKPLSGAWNPEWGGTNVTSLHNSEGWYIARVLVELYRHDAQHGSTNTAHLQAIDELFNWAKHFVWSRNEFDDVPSSPFAIGSTLCSAFLLDYYFTFKDDAVRSANATLALHLAQNVTWRYLQCWAMDSDRQDADIDGAFLAEPNSGRDWAALACANEVNWNIDALTEVYVHTGDSRMRYYLRGMLQRWPALYRAIYEPSIAQYGSDALTEGYGLFDGAGPGRGNRYDYGFTEPLPFSEPISNSTVRVVAGARAAIAFDKGRANRDIADYRTDGNGNCYFRVVGEPAVTFPVSFSYPFVDISRLPVTRHRGTQTITLDANQLVHPSQSPSSLYFLQLQNNDLVTIGAMPTNAIIPLSSPLTYDESAVEPITNGFFVSTAPAGNYLLPQDWTDRHSFAGLVAGLRWGCGVPYQQRLYAITNVSAIPAAGPPNAYTAIVAYSPPEDQTLTIFPRLILDDDSVLPLSGHPALAWRGWPMLFNKMVLLDSAVIPAGRGLKQIDPSGSSVMDVTKFTGNANQWRPVQAALSNASAAFVLSEQQRQMLVALQASFSTLPANKIALLPLDTAGAPANFASLTGLNLKWRAITEAQLVNTATFNPTLYPLAFYLGSENYVKSVITTGDAKAAITSYLTNGGTLVILASGPFPFYYGYGPNDQAGPADPLLPTLGLPIYNAFETAPPNLSMVVSTNQGVIHSVPSVFPFPPGDQRLRPVNRSQVSASHRYVPWISVTNFAGTSYGDAACFIEFGSGPAKGGKIIYIWSTLLSGPQGQALMADAVSWIIDATLRPSPSRINSIQRLANGSVALDFDASSNLDYALQYRGSLTVGVWSLLRDFGSSPVDRVWSYTNSTTPQSGFFRLWVRP
jgi:hypothetical protein